MTQTEFILTDIPFTLDFSQLAEKLHLKAGSSYIPQLETLVAQAQAIAKPKALYQIMPIESRGDDWVMIGGVTFSSRILSVNLAKANRVFLFTATGGTELEAWVKSIGDFLHNYWADAIAEMALRSAIEALNAHIDDRFQPGQTSVMNPGSLADWPLQQQRALFSLLGDTKQAIGVELQESLLMSPVKSVSGIAFPTDERFASCQLCPMEACPNRKAPYNQSLYEEKYCAAS